MVEDITCEEVVGTIEEVKDVDEELEDDEGVRLEEEEEEVDIELVVDVDDTPNRLAANAPAAMITITTMTITIVAVLLIAPFSFSFSKVLFPCTSSVSLIGSYIRFCRKLRTNFSVLSNFIGSLNLHGTRILQVAFCRLYE